jgi:hypothetical protein
MILNVQSIVVGCNYHTKWQSNKQMRFILAEVKDGKARLKTRRTNKDFWTNVDDLIFIMTKHNLDKAREILKNGK